MLFLSSKMSLQKVLRITPLLTTFRWSLSDKRSSLAIQSPLMVCIRKVYTVENAFNVFTCREPLSSACSKSEYHSLTSRCLQAAKDFFGPNSAKNKIPDDRRAQIQRKPTLKKVELTLKSNPFRDIRVCPTSIFLSVDLVPTLAIPKTALDRG